MLSIKNTLKNLINLKNGGSIMKTTNTTTNTAAATNTTTTNNQSFMTVADLDYIVNNKICDKIAYKLLMHLFAKGSQSAYDIAIQRSNGVISFDDIAQEMLLHLTEYSTKWSLQHDSCNNSYNIIFTDSDIESDFYKIPSRILYQNKTRHELRREWLEINEQVIRADDVSALSEYTTIDNVLSNIEFQEFLEFLKNNCKKAICNRYINELELRISGYKYAEISNTLEIKESQVKKDFQTLKNLWKKFHEEA